MIATTDDSFHFSEPTMLRRVSRENADLRAHCVGVAEQLERLSPVRPEPAALQPRAMRLRKRLLEAGNQ